MKWADCRLSSGSLNAVAGRHRSLSVVQELKGTREGKRPTPALALMSPSTGSLSIVVVDPNHR